MIAVLTFLIGLIIGWFSGGYILRLMIRLYGYNNNTNLRLPFIVKKGG